MSIPNQVANGVRGVSTDAGIYRPRRAICRPMALRCAVHRISAPTRMAHRRGKMVDLARQLLSNPALRHRWATGAGGDRPEPHDPWTLGASVQGHCEYLRQKFPGVEPLSVVIAFDVRRFLDSRKVYNPELPNPVLGLSSKDLAHHAAGVYAANAIHVHVLPPDSPRFVSTPEMSFTIRHLVLMAG